MPRLCIGGRISVQGHAPWRRGWARRYRQTGTGAFALRYERERLPARPFNGQGVRRANPATREGVRDACARRRNRLRNGFRRLGYEARKPRCVAHGQKRQHRKNGCSERGTALLGRLGGCRRQPAQAAGGTRPAKRRAMDHALRNRAGRRRSGWRRTAPPLQIRCAAGGNAGGCQTDRCGLAGDGGRQRMERLRPAGSGRCGRAPKKTWIPP